jgi:hypothetical protein
MFHITKWCFPGIKDWLTTFVIGFLVTSYWRGTWTLLDIWLCDQPADAGLTSADSFCFAGLPDEAVKHRNSGWLSMGIGMFLTAIGVSLMWLDFWRPQVSNVKHRVQIPARRIVIRFLLVYTLGMASVNIWRGVWYLTDYFLLPNKLTATEWGDFPLASYWVSSVVGSTVCFLFYAGPCLLAPPAIFLIDGPGINPPPIAVTLISSYYSLTLPADHSIPDLSHTVITLDLLFSFLGVPIMVVWFWRGSWLLLDYYLYGFSPNSHDVHFSILWSSIVGVSFLIVCSETIFAYIRVRNTVVLLLLGRLRTFILAWGTVNFWRAVWYIWDEFLGGSTQWSCWLAHAASIALLTSFGCMSCILAPASTLGVDAVPHKDCADDPLFSNLPVPADDLFLFGIGRQPLTLEQSALPRKSLENQKHHLQTSSKGLNVDGSPLTRTSVAISLESKNDEGEAWRSGGTGRRGSYSSVRSEEISLSNNSYLGRQRPDLDRRVSRADLVSSGQSVRRSSQFFRNR